MGKIIPKYILSGAIPVHPHVRGENVHAVELALLDNGSPPRAWGKWFRWSAGRPLSPVHPHVRGENSTLPALPPSVSGSPPRAWGKCERGLIGLSMGRFTPTCVGKITSSTGRMFRYTVHPHVRGENSSRIAMSHLASGSPPRAWGKLYHRGNTRILIRFTPTCVGKIRFGNCSLCIPPVHPHVRGENGAVSCWRWPTRGSPPRAWGKCYKRVHVEHVHRFTPTCVGKINVHRGGVSIVAVHPHVRGENACTMPDRKVKNGSPPRAWGKFSCVIIPAAQTRFTPTCVGKILNLHEISHSLCPSLSESGTGPPYLQHRDMVCDTLL